MIDLVVSVYIRLLFVHLFIRQIYINNTLFVFILDQVWWTMIHNGTVRIDLIATVTWISIWLFIIIFVIVLIQVIILLSILFIIFCQISFKSLVFCLIIISTNNNLIIFILLKSIMFFQVCFTPLIRSLLLILVICYFNLFRIDIFGIILFLVSLLCLCQICIRYACRLLNLSLIMSMILLYVISICLILFAHHIALFKTCSLIYFMIVLW